MRPGVAEGFHQMCTAHRAFAAVLLLRLDPFLRGPGLTLHRGKYVRALHAEDEPCLPMPVSKVVGFLASVGFDTPHCVDQLAVGGGVARRIIVHFSSGGVPTMLYSYGVVVANSNSS